MNIKVFKTLVMTVMTLFMFCASLSLAQGESAQLINTLRQNFKIIEPELVLEDFVQGKATTRVIVNLSEPTWSLERKIKDPSFRKKLQEAVQAAQDKVIGKLDPGKVSITNRFVYIFGFSAEITLEGLKELTEIDEVVSINKDRILKPHLAQGIPLINASTVRTTYNGSGVAIAICDTGIDYTHPRLGGGGFPNAKVIGGYDTGEDDNDPMDEHGHGTCCAGIAAGDLGTVGDYIGGVAYSARLYAVKISHAPQHTAYTSDMIEGWEWCVTHQNDDPNNPIMVISTSFGGGYYTSTCDSEVPAMSTAAANAVAAGITIFSSSGNEGFCDGMGWPACITHVNAVGAVYDTNIGPKYGWCISPDSCIGYSAPGCPLGWACDDTSTSADLVTCYSNTATFLDLFAPNNNTYTTDIVGSGGYSTGDYYSTFGGTSASCPYAAGAAACLQNGAKAITGSFLSPVEVRALLTSTGDLITDTKEGNISLTKPRVNLGAAVNAIGVGKHFIIYNDGTADLEITSMTKRDNDPWLDFSPKAPFTVAPGQSQVVRITVDWDLVPGTGDDERIIIKSNDSDLSPYPDAVYVTAQKSCTYSISPTSKHFGSNGGTGSVNVTTQAGCAWTAVSHADWITITGGSPGTGSGIVYYSVSENSSKSSRTGTITIANETFTVTQSGTPTHKPMPWLHLLLEE